MLVEQCRAYFVRSIELERKIASWVASGFRFRHASGRDDLDALRDRLETAQRRVARNQRLVAGWREVIETQQGDGRDLELAYDLLETFENDLQEAMSSEAAAQGALLQRLLDIFEGLMGRLPQNDRELHDWLASPEGKAATAFEPTSASRWGEVGRS